MNVSNMATMFLTLYTQQLAVLRLQILGEKLLWAFAFNSKTSATSTYIIL